MVDDDLDIRPPATNIVINPLLNVVWALDEMQLTDESERENASNSY
jgi:hypothetical protein